MTSWLDIVTESRKFSESPQRYYWWAGAACISAAVKKRVYLDKFLYKLYPNIFVLIVSAKSGLRKGDPISLVRDILDDLNHTKVISGQNSIQSVLDVLGSQITLAPKNGDRGAVLDTAQGILVSGELHNLLLDDPKAVSLLVDLYNTHEQKHGFDKGLRSEKKHLKDPCLSIIGASNEEYLGMLLKSAEIKGGFLARSIVVHETKKNKTNSLMFAPELFISNEELMEYPRKLKEVKGEFTMSKLVRLEFDDWYNKFSRDIEDVEDITGTLDRFHDHVLKMSMIISLSESIDLEITSKHINQAILKCKECFEGTKIVSSGGSANLEVSPTIAQMLKVLVDSPNQEISRKDLLSKMWKNGVDSITLDRALDTIGDNGVEAVETIRKAGKIFYRMKGEYYEQYKRWVN
jgi:hypothetical protein